jgi:hypothetical protein
MYYNRGSVVSQAACAIVPIMEGHTHSEDETSLLAESAEVQKTPTELGRDLKRTLIYSFAVSQGSPQDHLLELAGAWYKTTYGRDAIDAAAATVSKDEIRDLRVPGSHGSVANYGQPYLDPKSDEGRHVVSAQFSHYWENGMNTLLFEARHSSFVYDPYAVDCERRLAAELADIVTTDLRFMRETTADSRGEVIPFEGRRSGSDPRKSFIREHVLGRATIRDPVLDSILHDMRAILLGRPVADIDGVTLKGAKTVCDNMVPKIIDLAAKWEAFHPGEKFLDPEEYAGTTLLAILESNEEIKQQ